MTGTEPKMSKAVIQENDYNTTLPSYYGLCHPKSCTLSLGQWSSSYIINLYFLCSRFGCGNDFCFYLFYGYSIFPYLLFVHVVCFSASNFLIQFFRYSHKCNFLRKVSLFPISLRLQQTLILLFPVICQISFQCFLMAHI